jgi:nicotinate-nucleotide adenylyltransferase
MKWGLLGGTFDPIHLGHLRCAEEMREIFGLDKIIFIPAARPPLKKNEITPFADRLKMIRLAIRGNPAFEVSTIEGRRKGRSYTIDTVRHFLDLQGKGLELFFILGEDAFRDIRLWKDWEELLSRCHFAVMNRPGFGKEDLAGILTPQLAARCRYIRSRSGFRGPAGTFIFFRPVTCLDISSTDIRKRLAEGKSVRYLIPERVLDYIYKKSLYHADPMHNIFI